MNVLRGLSEDTSETGALFALKILDGFRVLCIAVESSVHQKA
jgi:hypothetical protein